MKAAEIKSDIHKIVDRIENEQMLYAIHDFLKNNENSQPGELWQSLTEKQKQEVLLAYEESEDESQLVDVKEMFEKLR